VTRGINSQGLRGKIHPDRMQLLVQLKDLGQSSSQDIYDIAFPYPEIQSSTLIRHLVFLVYLQWWSVFHIHPIFGCTFMGES
jgi:hypothetical protein